MNPTDWTPGLLVLAGGLLLAVGFVLFSRRGKGKAEPAQDEVLADLEQRYATLIAQLKELTADRANLPEERFQAEKTRLELAAAAALKARDAHVRGAKHEAEKAAARAERVKKAAEAAAQGFWGKHPQLKGALWGAGVVGFLAVLGWVLVQESKPRTDGMQATGKTPGEEGQSEAAEVEAFLQAAMERVRKNPDDVEAFAEVTHELIARQAFEHAYPLVERGIGLDPFHVDLRIHRAVLRAAQGEGAAARAELEHLAATYPEAYEALLYIGALAMRDGDRGRALQSFERYLTAAPAEAQPPGLRMTVAQLRRMVPSAGASPSPAEPSHP